MDCAPSISVNVLVVAERLCIVPLCDEIFVERNESIIL